MNLRTQTQALCPPHCVPRPWSHPHTAQQRARPPSGQWGTSHSHDGSLDAPGPAPSPHPATQAHLPLGAPSEEPVHSVGARAVSPGRCGPSPCPSVISQPTFRITTGVLGPALVQDDVAVPRRPPGSVAGASPTWVRGFRCPGKPGSGQALGKPGPVRAPSGLLWSVPSLVFSHASSAAPAGNSAYGCTSRVRLCTGVEHTCVEHTLSSGQFLSSVSSSNSLRPQGTFSLQHR